MSLSSVSLMLKGDDELPIGAAAQTGRDELRAGVVILDRMPGFVGFRMLRDGDVVVGTAEQPQSRFRTPDDLKAVVERSKPGDALHLILLRQGQVVQVPIQPDPRPADADRPLAIDDLLRPRREKADEYWQRTFAPLLEPGVS